MEIITTKERIVNAFMEVAEKKPADSITVREVCRKAGVSTVTFYNHFADKFEMLTWMSVNTIKREFARLGPQLTWRDFLVEAIARNREEGGVLQNLIRNTGGYQGFASTSYRANLEGLIGRIEKSDGSVSPRLRIAAETYLHGVYDVFEEWALSGMIGNAEELADGLCDAVPEVLKPYLP